MSDGIYEIGWKADETTKGWWIEHKTVRTISVNQVTHQPISKGLAMAFYSNFVE